MTGAASYNDGVRVKICGITRPADARAASDAGADAIGFVFVPGTPRYVTVEQAREAAGAASPFVARIGVFRGQAAATVAQVARELRLTAVQLHGEMGRDDIAALAGEFPVIRALSWSPELEAADLTAGPWHSVLLDGIRPGSGQAFDWDAAARLRALPGLILAGGLNVQNVRQGIAALQPAAVDVSSGVEAAPGLKDAGLMEQFIRAARNTSINEVSGGFPGPGVAASPGGSDPAEK